MKKFESQLKLAQSRQRRKFTLSIVGLLSSIFLAGVLFAFSSGTSVRVLPEDASKISEIKIIDSIGFSISNVVYSVSRHPKISVSAVGFMPRSVTLSPAERGGNIEVSLSELPGHLYITTKPLTRSIRWKINNKRISIGSVLDYELPSGTYDLEINTPFFKIENHSVEIERGKKNEMVIELRPIQGKIKINSQPSGANVSHNGTDVGPTPVTLAVEGGQHRIEVGGGKFKTARETIEITNTLNQVARDYRLLRKTALLKLQLKPRGGTLLVDGKKTKLGKTYAVDASVNHTITYMLDGYYTVNKKVKLAPAETKKVFINLEAELGKIELRSDPVSNISIDGAPAGKTPLILTLPSRPHVVKFSKRGFRSIKKTVEPASGRTTKVFENLQAESVARLREAPKDYVNSVGIELRLFVPTSVKTGAPRHERGQRANEFQRNVKFTKPFYAGKYEITNSQFNKFKTSRRVNGRGQHPVVSVSWIEAAKFCNWLSDKENLKPFYVFKKGVLDRVNSASNGYRMLTEAEWEWLARVAGKKTQTIFPWGNNTTIPSSVGNIADEAARGTVRFYVPNYVDGIPALGPVGSFSAEASGLFDLTGNASEWVHDYYSLQPPAKNEVVIDPLGPTIGGVHVIKGASWRSGTRTTLRAAFRDGLVDRRDDVGFRIGRYL